MKYLHLKTTDPYVNLAIEEYLFENSDDDVFLLWQNSPTVVIGKNQNAYAEIDHEYLREHNILIARRITGGGAVYHDLGNVNYTFISKARSEGIDFKFFTSPIVEALSSIGVKCELSGRNDLLVAGKKISGNAQCTKKGRVLHHGTLLFDSDLSVLSAVLKVDEEKIKAKALKSTRSRVANIKSFLNESYATDHFIEKIEDFVIKKFSPEILDISINTDIIKYSERNSSPEWIFPKSEFLSSYNLFFKRKYDFGLVSINVEMMTDTIKAIKISGDFFGNNSVENLEKILSNTSLFEIDNILSKVNIEDYIHGMTNSQFVELIRR